MWASAPTKRRGLHQPPGPAAHSGASAPRMEGMGGNCGGNHPQRGAAPPDNPSVSLRLTAPFAQGSLRDGGCGSPRRFAPRNDSPKPLSFRGGPTGRRGNPSFLRWTMDGGPGRPTKDEGNGTPSRRPLRKAQSTTQASRRAAKRPRQRPRGVGGNRRKDHPKRGQPPRLPGQRLAKRKARG